MSTLLTWETLQGRLSDLRHSLPTAIVKVLSGCRKKKALDWRAVLIMQTLDDDAALFRPCGFHLEHL